MLTEDGGNPAEDPGLDELYELLVETIRDYLEREEPEE